MLAVVSRLRPQEGLRGIVRAGCVQIRGAPKPSHTREDVARANRSSTKRRDISSGPTAGLEPVPKLFRGARTPRPARRMFQSNGVASVPPRPRPLPPSDSREKNARRPDRIHRGLETSDEGRPASYADAPPRQGEELERGGAERPAWRHWNRPRLPGP